jgi:hypothetical protein
MKIAWPNFQNSQTAKSYVFGWCVVCLFIGSSVLLSWSKPSPQAVQPAPAQTSKSPAQPLSSAQIAQMSSDQLTHYVFEHQGCNSCHTIGADKKLGFTDRGRELGKGFEGCVTMLTSINMITLVKDADRSATEKTKMARFEEFGCSTCHQIVPGKMGLTKYGVKLKSMHLPCTETCCPR